MAKAKGVKANTIKTKKAKKQKKPRKEKSKFLTVASPLNPSMSFMVASELADDEIIEQELVGAVIPQYIYKFVNQGKEVVGLSVLGVRDVVRRLNRNPSSGYKIRLNPEHRIIERDIEYDGEKGVEVSVYAEDLLLGNGAWGMKFEPYYKDKKDKTGKYFNKFALEIALSKAERNAMRKLMPEPVAIAMISKMLKEDKTGNTVKILQAPMMNNKIIKKVSAPVASADVKIWEMFVKAISKCKSINDLGDLSGKLTSSKKYPEEMKKKVFELIGRRFEELGLPENLR